MSKTLTNADGFNLALAFFIEENGGRRYGSKTRMAAALDVSRAVVDSWEGVGIPRRHLEKTAKVTGIDIQLLRPDPTS